MKVTATKLPDREELVVQPGEIEIVLRITVDQATSMFNLGHDRGREAERVRVEMQNNLLTQVRQSVEEQM